MKSQHKVNSKNRDISGDIQLYLDTLNKNNIKYFDKIDAVSYPTRFLLILENIDHLSEGVIEKLHSILLEGMSLEKLISLLRRLGVEESVAEAVRIEVEHDRSFAIVTLEPQPGINVERVLSEVQFEAELDRLESADTPRSNASRKLQGPTNWNEATAIVPKLRKWVEVKREGLAAGHALRDILIQHLRDRECGIGHWAASGSDFPVGALRHFNQTLRHDIGNPAQWEFPEDIRIVSGSRGRPAGSLDTEPRDRRVTQPTSQEAREAWRIAKRAQRSGYSK